MVAIAGVINFSATQLTEPAGITTMYFDLDFFPNCEGHGVARNKNNAGYENCVGRVMHHLTKTYASSKSLYIWAISKVKNL